MAKIRKSVLPKLHFSFLDLCFIFFFLDFIFPESRKKKSYPEDKKPEGKSTEFE